MYRSTIRARPLLRQHALLRQPVLRRPAARFNSSTSSSANGAATNPLTAGLIGGFTTLGVAYAWYHFSGAKQAVNLAKSGVNAYESVKQNVKEKTPEPTEALKFLRSTIDQYIGLIPGAKPYVDSLFQDLDQLSERHGNKVNEILSRTYNEIKDATKGGLNAETGQKVLQILQQRVREIRSLASDVSDDIMKAHPELQEKVGGSLDELKKLADKAGPEAQKKVDEVYEQIQAIVNKGLTPAGVASAGYLINDVMSSIRQTADQSWTEGLQMAKPILDKYPQVKRLVEENADSLKSGNVKELFSNLTSGNSSSDIESYIMDKVSQAKQLSTKDFEKYVKQIPGVERIPHYDEFMQLLKDQSQDAEKLIKDTYEEIKKVLERKTDEASKILQKTKEEGKQKVR